MLSVFLQAGLLGLAALINRVIAQQDDLGSILKSKENLSTYYNLIKVRLSAVLIASTPHHHGVAAKMAI